MKTHDAATSTFGMRSPWCRSMPVSRTPTRTPLPLLTAYEPDEVASIARELITAEAKVALEEATVATPTAFMLTTRPPAAAIAPYAAAEALWSIRTTYCAVAARAGPPRTSIDATRQTVAKATSVLLFLTVLPLISTLRKCGGEHSRAGW